ncbi:AraC family transcriptional regulator [Paenibacillus sp. KQZ6P-2]|uniref:AraC family transcriptional regulator n=1 Tax=Paenibacillus mangrovi TaxID=2931978 RepID=A0A9X1WNH9_9BACL|nr:AraC family transcriptional regulator [Paenibacillus mangrovi]MCJ8012144.1 AraC family transcriptional regulator [Paenibacillus mangrovi]
MKKEDVSVSMLWPIRKLIVMKGYDWDAFCIEAGIDGGLFSQTEARIEAGELERIVQAAADFTGDQAFGLHQGQSMNISDLGVLGYVMFHSKTIGEALVAYQKYNYVVCSQYNIELEHAGANITLRLFLNYSVHGFSRHCIEDMAVSLIQIMLQLSGRPIKPLGAGFSHERCAPEEEYMAALGIAPLFGQEENTLTFTRDMLDFPVIGADTRLLGVFETIAEEVRVKLAQGSVLSSRLREWILSCMPSFFPTLQDAAREMKLSARTLQARLKEEQTTYNRLANEVRRELAIRHLAQPEHTIAEIAYLLHFSEPSSFQAAFKKWTGTAPGEYRQQLFA